MKKEIKKSNIIEIFVRMQILKTIFSTNFILIRFMKPANIFDMPVPINQSALVPKLFKQVTK